MISPQVGSISRNRGYLHGGRKILEGRTIFRWANMLSRSVWFPSRESREGLRRNSKWRVTKTKMQFGTFRSFRRYAELSQQSALGRTPNPWLGTDRSVAIFVWFVPRTVFSAYSEGILHGASILLVLGSSNLSAVKILALGASATLCM